MITVRKAEPQDFPAIYTLMKNELGYPNLREADTFKRLEFFSSSDDWETFVALTGGEAVGFIGVTKCLAYNIDGYYTQIMAMAVSEKLQGSGIGTALVKKAEEWSMSHGITGIYVSSNIKRSSAHAFYEKNGYINSKQSYMFIKSIDIPEMMDFCIQRLEGIDNDKELNLPASYNTQMENAGKDKEFLSRTLNCANDFSVIDGETDC